MRLNWFRRGLLRPKEDILDTLIRKEERRLVVEEEATESNEVLVYTCG